MAKQPCLSPALERSSFLIEECLCVLFGHVVGCGVIIPSAVCVLVRVAELVIVGNMESAWGRVVAVTEGSAVSVWVLALVTVDDTEGAAESVVLLVVVRVGDTEASGESVGVLVVVIVDDVEDSAGSARALELVTVDDTDGALESVALLDMVCVLDTEAAWERVVVLVADRVTVGSPEE